jgi:hypothetical protein
VNDPADRGIEPDWVHNYKVEGAAGPEHSMHLAEHCGWIVHEHECQVARHGIHARSAQREDLSSSDGELSGRRYGSRELKINCAEIDTNEVTAWCTSGDSRE